MVSARGGVEIRENLVGCADPTSGCAMGAVDSHRAVEGVGKGGIMSGRNSKGGGDNRGGSAKFGRRRSARDFLAHVFDGWEQEEVSEGKSIERRNFDRKIVYHLIVTKNCFYLESFSSATTATGTFVDLCRSFGSRRVQFLQYIIVDSMRWEPTEGRSAPSREKQSTVENKCIFSKLQLFRKFSKFSKFFTPNHLAFIVEFYFDSIDSHST